jgi:hypothetical protein
MLNKSIKVIVWVALAAALVIAFGFELDDAARYKADHEAQYNKRTPDKNTNDIVEAEKADDRIARYTRWLALLTGGLVISNAIQFIFLYRADKTARVSADAAKLNAEAVIGAERAHLFVIVVENNVHVAMRGVRLYGGDQSAAMHDSRIPRVTLDFVIKNTGRTAAVLRDVSYQFLQADAETIDWRYSFADTIVVPVIEGNSQTEPATPCVAESELTIADGRAALDDERPLFFYGFVTFRDIFKRDYQYFWRYQYRAGRFALVHEQEQHPPSIY